MKDINYIFGSLILAVFFALTCFSCGSKDVQDIKGYYYPVDGLKDGLVYEYRAKKDSLAPYYWFFRTIEQGDSTFLLGQSYNHNFEVQQLIAEEILSNGSILKSCSFYTLPDSLGRQEKIDAEILAKNVFPFEVRDSGGVFVYNIKFPEPGQQNVTTTLVRNRRYEGKTTYKYQNRDVDCVKFSVKELIDNEADGHLEIQFESEELYAKGIGLVYSRKKVDKTLTLEYELVDTYPMTELEKKFKAQAIE